MKTITGGLAPSDITRARWPLRGLRLLVALSVAAPFWFWKGGLIEIEALQFIQQYLDGRPLVQKVFDPHANDFGTYQARELSYFLDYIDAHVFGWLMGHDWLVFVPLTALVASLLTIGIYFGAIRRYRLLPATSATLVLLLYLSNYIHLVTTGMFYRSTKPMLAPVLMATAFYLAALLEAAPGRSPTVRDPSMTGAEPRSDSNRAAITVFVLFCVMSLLDRQGFFYAVLGCTVLAIHFWFSRRERRVALAGAAAVVAMAFYNLVLAPAIVRRVSGYSPSFEYQRLPLANLLSDVRYYNHAGELLLQAGSVLMGSLPYWACACVVGFLLTAALRRQHLDPRSWTIPETVLVCIIVLAAQVAMFASMILRHPPVYEFFDHRMWYYPLPFQAFLVTMLVVLLNRSVSLWDRRRIVVLNLILILGVISNVARWDDYRDRMLRSRWFPTVYYQTDAFKTSLREGRPRPGLSTEYFGFYQYCLTLSPALQARSGRPTASAAVGSTSIAW